jgi:hypothetical protein
LLGASTAGKLLLTTVIDKFKPLAVGAPPSGRYDLAYFEVQLNFIQLLLEHRLFMQAFTAMREMIASFGLVANKKARTDNNAGRGQRRKGEVFINMVQVQEAEWDFNRVRA